MGNKWLDLEGKVVKAWTGIERQNYWPAMWVPTSQKHDGIVFSTAFAGDPNLGRFPRASATARSIGLLLAKNENLYWLLAGSDVVPAIGRLLCRDTAEGFERVRFDVALLGPGAIGRTNDSEKRLAHGVLLGRQIRDRQNPDGPSLSWRYALGGVTGVGFLGAPDGVEVGDELLPMDYFGSDDTSWLRNVNFT